MSCFACRDYKNPVCCNDCEMKNRCPYSFPDCADCERKDRDIHILKTVKGVAPKEVISG